MKKVIVISTSLRHGSNSDMLAEKFTDEKNITFWEINREGETIEVCV